MMLLTYLFIFAIVLFLIGLTNSYSYKIEDRNIITYNSFGKVRHTINIDDVLKVYKTDYPDEFLLSRRRGVSAIDGFIQIEYISNKVWKSATVTPEDSDILLKQIGLLQKDSTVKSFRTVSKQALFTKIIKLILLLFAITIGLDLSNRVIHYGSIVNKYHLGYLSLIIFISPFFEYGVLSYYFEKCTRSLYKDYHDNFNDYVIRS